jgi:aspartate-semialdehyde dehydrogenase
MSKKYNVAVVGATGNVGRQMLDVLAERKFPVDQVFAVASSSSKGREISFGEDKTLIVEDLEYFDFSKCQIALFSPGASVSKVHAPRAAKAGCVVIDNTSQFRMDEDKALVVPEVNAHALKDFRKTNIIANPNCSTIQMVVALKPLQELAKIKRVVVSTYQSVSGAGKEAMDELYNQTKGVYVSNIKDPEVFQKRIAFNLIPQIDVFITEGPYAGYTKEEWKMVVETKKIMEADIEVTATCVRVPVFLSHSECVNVEFDREVSEEEVFAALRKAKGVIVIDERKPGGYATPFECAGKDETFVSRIRKDNTNPKAINMWVVADNIRKGAATNSIQIAEELIANFGL